jgi:hypothetical protein
VTPLAGSPAELVFSRQVHLSEDTSALGSGLGVGQAGGISTAFAVSRSGRTVKLGRFPAGVTTQIGEWSTSGALVAVGDYSYGYPTAHKAYVWQLPSGHRRAVVLAAHDHYLTVMPKGVVYATPAGEIKVRGLNGAVSVLRRHPFGKITANELIFAVAGPKGLVIAGGAHPTTYIPFDRSQAPVHLHNAGQDESPVCLQASATYAACTFEDGDGDYYRPGDSILVPLDGGPATIPDRTYDDGDAALLGSKTLVYWADGKVYIREPGSGVSHPSGLPGGREIDVVGALGKVYEANHAASALKALGPIGTVTTAVAPRRSPVTVDAFGLTAHRIVYADDQPVASRSGDIESVFTRAVSAGGGDVGVGAKQLVSPGTASVSGNIVAASDSVAVYATDHLPFNGPLVVTLQIVTKQSVHVIHNIGGDSFVRVSGHEVLYQGSSGRIEIYDTRNGHTWQITSAHHDTASAAIWRHHVAYATKRGAIYRENFITGQKIQLAPPHKNDIGGAQFAVYEYGPWVGWTAQPLKGELSHAVNLVRNATTMKPAIPVPHTLYSLTSAGAILASAKLTAYTDSAADDLSDGVPAPNATTWLWSYSGRVTPLLSKRRYVAGPQINGNLLAWAGQSGILKVRDLL